MAPSNTFTLIPTTAGAFTSETPSNTPSINGWPRNGASRASDSSTTRTSGTEMAGGRGDQSAGGGPRAYKPDHFARLFMTATGVPGVRRTGNKSRRMSRSARGAHPNDIEQALRAEEQG